MYIKWNPSFSVGIEKFDSQHKKLFSLIEVIISGIKERKTKEKIEEVLNELIHYTMTHFKAEEEAMLAAGFPGYAEHKAEHDTLTGRVKEFQRRHGEGTAMLSAEVIGFINEWLRNHIIKTDAMYAPFLNEKGIS